MKIIQKLLVVLCVCMLIASAPLFPAQAVESNAPTVTVSYHNLVFGNQVYILYAVDVTNTDEQVEPFMEFRRSATGAFESAVRPLAYRTLGNGDEKPYYVFAYTKLTAKEMADVVYARAGVTVGGKTYYSEEDDFSICEYAAYQLGVMPGYNGTTNGKLKEMLISMLDYGTKAQLYFGYRTDCLANNFYLTFGHTEEEKVATPGLKYQSNGDGTATVLKYEGNATDIVIASKNEQGETVTAIASNAFAETEIEIQSIYIAGSVRTIGDSAFSRLKSLTSVTIAEGVQSIGEKAFEGCRSLARVDLPVSVTEIKTCAFNCNGNLTIYYKGTKTQIEVLFQNNPNWDNCEKPTVILSDGSEYGY